MKQLLPALFYMVMSTAVFGQLAVYEDQLRHFWVFDRGEFEKIEYLPVTSYQVGGILVAYLDNSENLKVYHNGSTETILEGNPIMYHATDYLLGYSLYQQLWIYDDGNIEKVSIEADRYIVEDSLIAWHNKLKKTIEIYYDGEVFLLEDGLINWPVETFRSGDNTLAYVTQVDRQFKVFYRGEVNVLDNFTENMKFEAGRNLVAYYDTPDNSFYAFYKGEVLELESFPPMSFQVGDDIMAYVDNMGRFKYFRDGKVTEITSFAPDFYEVNDQSIVYREINLFNTIHENESFLIERYVPDVYELSYNTIAYLNENRFIKAYQFGRIYNISYKPVDKINLYRDLIIYRDGPNSVTVFYEGELYKNQR